VLQAVTDLPDERMAAPLAGKRAAAVPARRAVNRWPVH